MYTKFSELTLKPAYVACVMLMSLVLCLSHKCEPGLKKHMEVRNENEYFNLGSNLTLRFSPYGVHNLQFYSV